MIIDTWVTYAIIGVLAGSFAGLLGIGGGGIMAPMLLLIFDLRGDPPEVAAVGALATSTAAILFTAVPSAFMHYLHKSVNWRMLLWISPAAIIGAAAAAQFAQNSPPVLLVIGLTVFLCYGSLRVLRQRNATDTASPIMPRPLQLSVIGLPAGIIGTLTGTGGGIVIVPGLVHMQVPLIIAIGTSAGNTFFIALSGTLSYFGVGVDKVALLAMAPTCVVFALVGAQCANMLSRKSLSIVYGVLLGVLVIGLLRWLVLELQIW